MRNIAAIVRTGRNEKNRGFTLVELLVVIAIIGILASIVIPNVAENIRKGQITKAVSEVRGIDTAITSMLSDVQRSNFRNWFVKGSDPDILLNAPANATPPGLITAFDFYMTPGQFDQDLLATVVQDLGDFYTDMFYQLLRQGKNADIAVDLKPEIRQKLGNSYMDIGLDPWDQQYQFWLGPMRGKLQIFRSYRIDAAFTDDIENMELIDVYKYDVVQQGRENEKVPGSPKQDYYDATKPTFGSLGLVGGPGNEYNAFYGFPAPKDQPVYVYSRGDNQVVDANAITQKIFGPDEYPLWGGGDDINNWDKEQGWNNAPR